MLKVVIADDEVRVCSLICNLLDWASFDMRIVGTAHDGLEAFHLVEAEKPDLIVTDIRMPEMDGLTMIAKAKEVCPEAEMIIISGYRDFAYAQEAIKYGVNNYLLKPVRKEELEATLENVRCRFLQRAQKDSREEDLLQRIKRDNEQLRGVFFRDALLTDSPAGPVTTQTAQERYHYDFQPGAFRAFIVKLNFPCREEYAQNGASALYSKVMELLYQQLRPVCFEEECFPQRCFVYGLMNYAPTDAEAVRRQVLVCMNELLSQRSMFEHMDFTFGLGSVQEDAAGLRQSMRDAVIAVNHRLTDNSGSRLIENAPSGRLPEKALLEAFRSALLVPLEILDIPAALSAAEVLQREALSDLAVGGDALAHLCAGAFEMFLVMMRSLHSDMDIREPARAYQELAELAADGDALFGCLKERMKALIELQIGNLRQSVIRPVLRVKQYIQEHYAKPITLEDVSALAGFNPSYFSTLFKKETGMTFVEYLSAARINKAKELLHDELLSIAEVCDRVGYLDIKHFNKTFKKLTNVSPAEFRRIYS